MIVYKKNPTWLHKLFCKLGWHIAYEYLGESKIKIKYPFGEKEDSIHYWKCLYCGKEHTTDLPPSYD